MRDMFARFVIQQDILTHAAHGSLSTAAAKDVGIAERPLSRSRTDA